MKRMSPKSSTVLTAISMIIASLMVFSVGCAKKEEPEVIKIGAVLCLTGSGAAYGEDSYRGIQLAVDEINAKGGINNKLVRVILEDDQTEPSVSASATSKLIYQDKVQVIIGAVTSSSMLADAPIAEKAKVVMISPGASNPSISNAGDYIFRNWISDALEGKAMAKYLFEDEKVKRVAILYINNDYGLGLKEVFEDEYRKLGGELTAIESYNQDDTDFRTQLQKIIKSNPERIYLPGYYKEMALVLKQSKEIGNRIPFRSVVTFEEPELLKLAGGAAEGVIYSSPLYNPKDKSDIVVNFVEAFRKKFNREPGIFAAHGYDAVRIIASVLKTSSYDGTSIKNSLYEVTDFQGTSGVAAFDSNGDVIKPVAIKQVKDDAFINLLSVRLN